MMMHIGAKRPQPATNGNGRKKTPPCTSSALRERPNKWADASAASVWPIRRKSVRYRMRIWQSASRQSRQQSWPSPSRARRVCPKGNLARSAKSTIGGSAPSYTAYMGTAVPPVGETIQQWSAPQRPPSRPRGECEPPRPNAQGHPTEATADRRTLLTTVSTPLGTVQACSQAVYVCLYLSAMFGHDITALLIIM